MDVISFVSSLFTKMPRKPRRENKAQGELIGIAPDGLTCVYGDVDTIWLTRYDGKVLAQVSWGTDTPAEFQVGLQIDAQAKWGIEWELLPPVFDLSQWSD